eukprot:467212-Alexandrium_andersonii.AAC.1
MQRASALLSCSGDPSAACDGRRPLAIALSIHATAASTANTEHQPLQPHLQSSLDDSVAIRCRDPV